MRSSNKLDRRIVKTRKAIFNALIKLLAEQDLDDISVTDLSATADVNRKTFYLHYQSVDQVAEIARANFMTSVKDMISSAITGNTIDFRSMFDTANAHISDNETMYQLLANRKAISALAPKLESTVQSMIIPALINAYSIDEDNAVVLAAAIFAVASETYRLYLTGKVIKPIDEISSLALNSVNGIIEAYR